MFTQKCCIRKNTAKLFNKLTDLGYKHQQCIIKPCRDLLVVNNGYYSINFPYGKDDKDFIDCKDNEELFLAIAALRDDSDKNQWFVHNNKVFGDSGWEFCKDDKFQMIFYAGEIEDNEYFTDATDKFHKATVEELIEHFK